MSWSMSQLLRLAPLKSSEPSTHSVGARGLWGCAAGVEVIGGPSADAGAELVGLIIVKDLRVDPHLVLGLGTGRTMERVYRQLVHVHRKQGLDFSLCRTFNLDEYVGLA